MKILLSKELVQLNGEIIEDSSNNQKPMTVGKAMAYELQNNPAASELFGTLKTFVLMQKFYTGEEAEIDDADLKLLRELFEKKTKFSALIAGQILLALG